MKLVEIKQNNEMNELDIDISTGCIEKLLTKESTSQGLNCISELYSWSANGSKIICYGWYDGEAGLENKHDLPPSGISSFLEEDSSTILLFGSLFIVKKSKSNYKDIDVSDYSLFYSEYFGGFEDLDDSDDNSDDDSDNNSEGIENDEEEGGVVGDIVGDIVGELVDDDYKPDEESEDSYEYKSDNSYELDIDLNTY